MYGFRGDVLSRIEHLPPSPLDKAENLEQLRWLYEGYRIYTAETSVRTYPVDTRKTLRKPKRGRGRKRKYKMVCVKRPLKLHFDAN